VLSITSARRGELCALQVCDIDLENGVLHLAFNYVVVGGRRVRKDTKTHQDRYLAIDPVTCAMLREHLEAIRAECPGWPLQRQGHLKIVSTRFAGNDLQDPPLSAGDLCQPSGPDGEGQAKGQARGARDEPLATANRPVTIRPG